MSRVPSCFSWGAILFHCGPREADIQSSIRVREGLTPRFCEEDTLSKGFLDVRRRLAVLFGLWRCDVSLYLASGSEGRIVSGVYREPLGKRSWCFVQSFAAETEDTLSRFSGCV